VLDARLPRWNKYLVELLSRALPRGEEPLQRTHNTLVLKATQRATGDIAASCWR